MIYNQIVTWTAFAILAMFQLRRGARAGLDALGVTQVLDAKRKPDLTNDIFCVFKIFSDFDLIIQRFPFTLTLNRSVYGNLGPKGVLARWPIHLFKLNSNLAPLKNLFHKFVKVI